MLLSLFAFYNRFLVGVIVFLLHPFGSNRFLWVHFGELIIIDRPYWSYNKVVTPRSNMMKLRKEWRALQTYKKIMNFNRS